MEYIQKQQLQQLEVLLRFDVQFGIQHDACVDAMHSSCITTCNVRRDGFEMSDGTCDVQADGPILAMTTSAGDTIYVLTGTTCPTSLFC